MCDLNDTTKSFLKDSIEEDSEDNSDDNLKIVIDSPIPRKKALPLGLVRAKAKELLSSVPIPPVPWATPKQTSEVQVLFSEDLQRRCSGDEYIPVEEEVDKAVKVTRKELNDLVAELFDYAQDCLTNDEIETEKNEMSNYDQTAMNNSEIVESGEPSNKSQDKTDSLTLNLKFLCENKSRSMFYTINLTQALELVKYWEDLLASNTEEVKQMKFHIKKTMAESIDIPTFPHLIMDTISKSKVFLYPSLLPKLPFKSPRIFPKHKVSYTDAEDHLIALGLEQFIPLNALSTISVPVVDILKPQLYNTSVSIEIPILPKGLITSTPICSLNQRQNVRRPSGKKLLRSNEKGVKNKVDPITKFVECLSRPSQVSRLLSIYPVMKDLNSSKSQEEKENRVEILRTHKSSVSNIMLPSMPSIGTSVKNQSQNEVSSSSSSNTGRNQDKDITSTNNMCSSTKAESRKNTYLDFSTISSTSFQQPDTSTEVEFCNPTDSFQTITTICSANASASTSFKNLPSSTSSQGEEQPNTSINKAPNRMKQATSRENLEKVSGIKPPVRKEPSGAEKKLFALAYYDKMRETLEMEDYHKIMQILNDHEEGDAVDLYKKVEKVLSPKYQELADEFLLFLREKEAAAVGQLVPWIRMNNRSKFLRKLEIYFKDQPVQLRKIYKCLTELSQTVDVSMEKIKSTLLPMFRGNAVLSDLFLQNFLDEEPPPR
ncbi:hypothetical protein NQ314_009279 [Rhamnusium bicolor]|uniref:GON-4-like protein n=1 Tax=Rhamnusium bicolor TaxID=1586634 RepID=A0AAV8Y1D2_9CUCU|nr:hypothetical protein NQ314_009279 [Rhamnusium bicolor]